VGLRWCGVCSGHEPDSDDDTTDSDDEDTTSVPIRGVVTSPVKTASGYGSDVRVFTVVYYTWFVVEVLENFGTQTNR
jgi:hypothetical protein